MKRKSDVLEYEDTITNSETQNTQEMDTQEDNDYTISSEDDIDEFDLISLLRKAQYYNAYSDAENIHQLKQNILHGLKNNPSFEEVCLNTTDEESLNVVALAPWKWVAALEALAESHSIKELSLIKPPMTSEVGISLAAMLKHNTYIKKFILYCQETSNNPIFEQAIEEIASAIKHNRSIKVFEFTGCSNQIAINHILEGLGENNNITIVRVDEILQSNSNIQALASLISNNHKITKLGTYINEEMILEQSTLEKYSSLLKALKNNDSLTALYTLYTQCPIIVNQEIIEELQNVLIENNTLTQMLPFSTNQFLKVESDNSVREVSKDYIDLLERNKNFIDRTVDFIKGAFKYSQTHNDLSKFFMDRQLLKKAQNLSKIGEGLLNTKLQEIDWTNNTEVQKYAQLYRYKNLKQYNYKADYQRFHYGTPTAQDFLNDDITINGRPNTLTLKNIQNILISNYFELAGICNNNSLCETALPLEIWQHIISFVLGEGEAHHDFTV